MTRKGWIILSGAILGAAAVGFAWQQFSRTAEATWADPSNPALVSLGRDAYRTHCAACHGANLEGEKNWRQRRADGTLPAPPHDESGHTWHHSDRVLFDITKQGGQRNAPPGFVSRMPGFAGTMSDREIHAVLAYIKSRWPEAVRLRQDRINAGAR
jgi:mono/diheme cytochrome c family protein